MINYQKLYYSNYQKMFPNGDCIKITRRECFAPAIPPTTINSYQQRWYYDPEAGLAIRLPRNKMGDDLGKRNAADLRAEERQQAKQYSCVAKSGTVHCPITCNRCPHNEECVSKNDVTNGAKCAKRCGVCPQSFSRNFELDKPVGSNDDSTETYIDICI